MMLNRILARISRKQPVDGRSRRFVAAIDCMLNQNTRDRGAASLPAMNFAWLQLCHEHQIGVLQMPCPEIAALGFARSRQPRQSIREALESEHGQACCHRIAEQMADRIAIQVAAGDQLLAILGGNPKSPGCAVHNDASGLQDTSGVFMQALQVALRQRDIEARFRGMRDANPAMLAEDLAWFEKLIKRST